MTNERDKSLFILFNKHQARYFKKKFSEEKRRQVEVLAFDGIVSMNLSQYNIQHHSAEELIKENERREILTTSTHLLIEKMNSILIRLDAEGNLRMIDFFDCVKYQKFLEFLSVIYYHHYLSKLLSLFQPSRVVIFANISLLTILLDDICEKKNISLDKHPLPWHYRYIQSAYEALPFVTKERDILFHLFRKISNRSLSLEDIVSQLKMKKDTLEVALFTPLDNRRTLTNALEGFHTLAKKSSTIIVPLRKTSQKEELITAEKEPHVLTFNLSKILLTKKEKEEVYSTEFSSYLFPLFSDIFHSRENIINLHTFTNAFGLRAWYHDFISTSHLFEHLFSAIRPSIFMGDNFYDFTTRVGNLIAEQRGIESYAVTQLHQELFSPPYHSFRNHILNKHLPHSVAVHQQNTAVHIAQHTLIDNPDYVPRVQIINRDTVGVDYKKDSSKEFVILFTTQQHVHTFDYVKIVMHTVQTLSDTLSGYSVRLIIKPHPAEYAFLYKFTVRKRGAVAQVNASIGINEALAIADILVTSHSFTAIEALKQGKKVILLSFSRRAAEPDILLYRPLELTENPLVTEVHSVGELKTVLLKYAIMKK
ncbi:MAG: hypothetical protein AAB922_02040 [Patescibacteria group bacterium]